MHVRIVVLALCASAWAVPGTAQPPSMTLAEAMTLALRAHPSLGAKQSEVDARTAEVRQAGRRANPETSVEVEDLGRSPGTLSASQTTVSIAQGLEFGNKRELRVHLAQADLNVAFVDFTIARTELQRRVAEAFVAVVAAQEALALATAESETAAALAAAVHARVDAGVAAPPEADRADAAAGVARLGISEAQLALAAARDRLASFWQSPVSTVPQLSGPLAVQAVPSPEGVDLYLARSPLLVRAQSERERAHLPLQTSRLPLDIDDCTICLHIRGWLVSRSHGPCSTGNRIGNLRRSFGSMRLLRPWNRCD